MVNGRQKGHTWERDLANYLTPTLLPALNLDGPPEKIVTSRSKACHFGEDLILSTGPEATDFQRLPVSIEAKNCKQDAIEKWLDQAERQADGQPYVVVSKWDYHPIGQARVCWRWGGGFIETQLDNWVANYREWFRQQNVPF